MKNEEFMPQVLRIYAIGMMSLIFWIVISLICPQMGLEEIGENNGM